MVKFAAFAVRFKLFVELPSWLMLIEVAGIGALDPPITPIGFKSASLVRFMVSMLEDNFGDGYIQVFIFDLFQKIESFLKTLELVDLLLLSLQTFKYKDI